MSIKSNFAFSFTARQIGAMSIKSALAFCCYRVRRFVLLIYHSAIADQCQVSFCFLLHLLQIGVMSIPMVLCNLPNPVGLDWVGKHAINII